MNEERSGSFARLVRSGVGVLLGLLWVGIGLSIGWAIGDLADRLGLPARHATVVFTLALCAVVLIGWSYGSRLLYLEVRAGVAEATDGAPARQRSERAWAAAYAAPIIGVWLAISTLGGPTASSHSGTVRAVIAARAPAHVIARAKTFATHAAPASKNTYVVRAGDNLRAIAEHFYGSASDWSVIAKANAGKLHEASGARLVDPTLLPTGLELSIPTANAVTTAPPSPGTSSNSARHDEVFAVLAGFGLIGAAMLARRQARRRALQVMRSPVGARPPRLDEQTAAIEAELRPLAVTELPLWIDAANRLLFARLVADRSLKPPKISVVRAGPMGIELLLDEPVPQAPAGFLVLDGGRTWRVDPRLSLEELRAAAGVDPRPFLAGLIPIGEDDNGSYLVACGPGESLGVLGDGPVLARGLGAVVAHLANAPWGEVEFYRVGRAGFVGAAKMAEIDLDTLEVMAPGAEFDPLWRDGVPESQPIVLIEDADLAVAARRRAPAIVSVIGPLADADRLLYFEGTTVTIEPLGLRVRALLPTLAELEAAARLYEASNAIPEVQEEDKAALPFPDADLPVAGPVEVRVLRAIPDLVGDLDDDKVAAEAVNLVAYLALHDGQATTSKFRDVLGVFRSQDESKQQRTVWNATNRARTALGVRYLPLARGNEPYRISGEVTCDWLRFKKMSAIARALELDAQPVRAIEVLIIALELIGQGIPCSDDSIAGRFVWLDAEQITAEIESEVVKAAHSLAMLSIVHQPFVESMELAAWAIDRGRQVCPEAKALRDAAMFLADAENDSTKLQAEFDNAEAAVDALELGADVDAGTETLFISLERARRSAPPSSALT